jgi:hypothetical protein
MPAPTGLNIPAMTTDAERECYYRLVKEGVGNGAIVELGAWMGASTAYIAAAIKDSGVQTKAHVYDKFQSKPGHAAKVKAFYDKKGMKNIPLGPCLYALREGLGPLMDYVEPHPGQIEDMKWGDEPISVLITDAPKRVPAISPVLTKLRKALQPGSVMAWQDFCHFPSYEIPACLYRIREHIEFVEAVVPGTTLVFRVKSQWAAHEVSPEALALSKWTPEEIDEAWLYWSEFIPQEKALLFDCGAAMFLCDLGKSEQAVNLLTATEWEAMRRNHPQVRGKWRYLREARPDFVTRYAPLFQYLESQGVFEKEAA